MTDEVKSIAGRLRDYIQRYADPTSFANPIKGTAEILRDAIDMIEELSGKVEECETQIAGLETMLTTAQSAAKTWQRRAEAAERDLRSVIKDANDGCVLCIHYHPCAGKDCPQYVAGVGATGQDGKEYPDFKWSCEDFEHGTCPAMEDTPCNGCDFENHWQWCGPRKENGGKLNENA